MGRFNNSVEIVHETISVVWQFEASTDIGHRNTGILRTKPIRATIYVCVSSVFVFSYVG